MFRTIEITETVDGATYTGSVSVPKGWRVMDLLVETFTAWTAATADVDVGDSDAADALLTAQDLTSVFFASGGNLHGSAWGNAAGDGEPYGAGGTGKLYPNGDTITAVVTAGTPGGPTGVSRATVWMIPPTVTRRAVAAV